MLYIGTNFPNSAEYPKVLAETIKTEGSPFDAFAAAELNYVELSLKRDTLQPEAVQADVLALRKRGIHANFHPYYGCRGFGTSKEHSFLRPNITTALKMARQIAQDEGRRVVLNFHAAGWESQISRADLLQQSLDFHDWLMETVDELGADVLITTEHQLPPPPKQDRQRIGDHYAELLYMVEQKQHPHFKICWDMGHSSMRYAHYDAEPMPPDAFLPWVAHVHIHDVDYSEPNDHRLIGSGDAPLGEFVSRLLAVGYAGGFTMEYSAKEMFTADYVRFLQRSKAALLGLVPSHQVK